VVGLGARRAQHGDDVAERLRRLRREIITRERATDRIPSDLSRRHHNATGRAHPVRVSGRLRPPIRLDRLRRSLPAFPVPHPAHAPSLRRNRCSFPVAVRGSASTNSIRRGYL
jgi:hypothetical protein